MDALLNEAPREGSEDQRVVLYDITWRHYSQLLASRGDKSVPRMSYLQGTLELMTPSFDHETLGKMIARLLEAWSEETDTDLNGHKSWTIRRAQKERGVEPDECYVLGAKKNRPDIAIEVVRSHWAIDKLAIYAGLEVPEVWIWRKGSLNLYVLRSKKYHPARRSTLLPALDVGLLSQFVLATNQREAMRAYRAALRGLAS